MFRYVVGFIIWLVLAGAIAICFIGTIVLWLADDFIIPIFTFFNLKFHQQDNVQFGKEHGLH